jgi:hypothetical protein
MTFYFKGENVKKILGISIVTATMLMAGGEFTNMDNSYDDSLRAEIEALKAEVAELRKASENRGDKDNSKLIKKIKRLTKKINEVKAHDAKDNIKWSVDLRTALDSIEYKMADGSTKENNDLFSNRLWLNMAYSPTSNVIFKGQLGYNKAYGADMNNGRGRGYDQFDWITNESLTDDTIKLRQAYWLYLGKDFLGTGIPWTASLGRRPSTTGFLSHLREDDSPQSPLGHNIDVEFDGGSALFKLENLTGVSGMSFKICAGQGGTNAQARFSSDTSYAGDSTTKMDDIRLAGFIFVPYDDGQIKVKTNVFKAFNLPGMDMGATGLIPGLSTKGDQVGGVISVMIDGLSDDMDESEFLYNTKIFASYAVSETQPDAGKTMLGSADDERGDSYWVGAQVPVSFLGGKFGVEYNHGSEYWRSFTYAEDTMIGSKLAVRGDAIEAYYTQPLTKSLSAQIRYTKINYDYSGSNAFFGDDGTPMKISDIPSNSPMAGQIVEEAEDIRAYIRYRF